MMLHKSKPLMNLITIFDKETLIYTKIVFYFTVFVLPGSHGKMQLLILPFDHLHYGITLRYKQ